MDCLTNKQIHLRVSPTKQRACAGMKYRLLTEPWRGACRLLKQNTTIILTPVLFQSYSPGAVEIGMSGL